ncbi:MAG: hypothetical protein ACFFAL_05690 [Promethearchaeota archaeon]
MLVSIKNQQRMQLLVSLGLLIILAAGILMPMGAFNISEPKSYLHYQQKPNETSLKKPSQDCDIQKQLCEVQNYTFQNSQIKHGQVQRKDYQDVGYQRTFWTYDFTAAYFYEVNATLLGIGEYSLIFMEDSCIAELGELAAIIQTEYIRDEFDSNIYPRVTDLAGHPNGTLGDIDGDPRIIILLSRNRHIYYSERNELPFDYSNLCEMIYIHYQIPVVNVVAHEFHHLIWFNNEWDEPQFILEALAQYAMYHAGYLEPYNNLAPQVSNYLPHPEESLLYWNMYNEGGMNAVIDYGSAYLFAFYIAEQYGVEILRNLITEPADGPHGIEAVLQMAGYDITFNELYLNWITALTIDELGFNNNLYGFENLDARISSYYPVGVFPLHNQTIPLRYYGFHVHKLLIPPDGFTVQINKASNQSIGVSIAVHDAFGWYIYQNLHDEEDTIISDNIIGNRIDEAYIITSYMLADTPTTTRSDVIGLGPLASIDISIIPTHTESENPWSLIIPLAAFCGICLLIAIMIKKRIRNHIEEKIDIV